LLLELRFRIGPAPAYDKHLMCGRMRVIIHWFVVVQFVLLG
jgi:hypothetical protein